MKNRQWTPEQKKAASDRAKAVHADKKSSEVRQAMRIPIGSTRNITTVNDTPDGFIDHWVNDVPGRVTRVKQAGYEHVTSASVGDIGVDATHAEGGVISREMGQGVTAYLMRQRREYYDEDQAAKQVKIDESEDQIRRKPTDNYNDGFYGGVAIGRPINKQ